MFSTLVRVHRSRESKDTWKGMTIYLKDPVFNIDNLSSASLPSFKDGNATALTVHASCKDLLLYCRDELGKQDYYICNVQTQQWLPLPALPFYHRSIYVAFTCDPYYLYGERKDNISRDNIILNPAYRYSVVIVPYQGRYRTMMNAHLFSSNRNGNEWREIVLSLPKPCQLVTLTTGFVYDGKLHFVCYEGIIGFDPYDDDGNNTGIFNCQIINWPRPILLGGHCIGECQGRLYLLFFSDDERLLIWCLKDCKTSEWSLERNIAREEWIVQNHYISRYMEKNSRLGPSLGTLVAIHPTNPNIVYMLFPRWIVLCKLSAKTLQIVSPVAARDAGLSRHCLPFQSMLPIWPTPLPHLTGFAS